MGRVIKGILLAVCTAFGLAAHSQSYVPDLSYQSDRVEEKQPLYRNVFFEAFGPSAQFGISYDSRFTRGSNWGYRVGLGIGKGGALLNMTYCGGLTSWGVPMDVNGIFGRRSSRFEIGLGVHLGLMGYRYEKYLVGDVMDEGFNEYRSSISSRSVFYYFFYGNIGYRLQRKSGFMLRVGLTPVFRIGGNESANYFNPIPYFAPYLGLGYTFGK